MANFESTTVSNSVKLLKGKLKEARKFLEPYSCPGMEFFGIDEDGNFYVYGYDFFQIFKEVKVDEGTEDEYADLDTDNDLTDEFLKGMKKFIPEGKKLIIQSIGAEKCRFPVSGWQAVVTNKKVKHTCLSGE